MPQKSIYNNDVEIVQPQPVKVNRLPSSQISFVYAMIQAGVATITASIAAPPGTNSNILVALSLAIHGISLVVAFLIFFSSRLLQRLQRSR